MSGRLRIGFGLLLLIVVVFTGCEQTTTPERRDILGSWVSEGLSGVEIRMTIAETARAVDGAGGWVEGGTSFAFRVLGAIARDQTALYFDFSEREDVSFQGVFDGEDRITGELFGGGFQRTPVSFVRVRPD